MDVKHHYWHTWNKTKVPVLAFTPYCVQNGVPIWGPPNIGMSNIIPMLGGPQTGCMLHPIALIWHIPHIGIPYIGIPHIGFFNMDPYYWMTLYISVWNIQCGVYPMWVSNMWSTPYMIYILVWWHTIMKVSLSQLLRYLNQTSIIKTCIYCCSILDL